MALEALKGEQTFAECANRFGIQQTMIHSWKKALAEGAFGVVERGGKTATEIDEEQQAKFGELALTNGTGGFRGHTGATVLT
ncbi:MAG: hypothetical protein MJH10_08855 [Epibacterium sp.]|nr:hypothetical protein [Epibacterium sp.]NQX73643.1 hypothetical protein [Epibacterium sp.]